MRAQLRDGAHRVAVTGASGWFGRVTLELLHEALGAEGFSRRVACYASRPQTITVAGTHVAARPLAELPGDPAPDLVLHYAFLTRDRIADLGGEAFTRLNLEITARVLSLVEGRGVRGLLYTSSGAVYGDRRRLTTDPAEPYGFLKHLDELALRQACRDAAARSFVCRVFATSGPHMTKTERYALGDLIAQVRRGGPVEVRAQRPVIRAYTAIADLVGVGLSSLLDPDLPDDLVIDSGGEPVEVGDLARRIARALDRPDLVPRRRWDPDAAADVYVGDPSELDRLCDRFGLMRQTLEEQIRATAAAT